MDRDWARLHHHPSQAGQNAGLISLEAYAKNLVALSKDFRVITFDYVGHGLSSKPDREYTQLLFAEQLCELMDSLGIDRAHLSGESLGGWVPAIFAANNLERVGHLILNIAGGLPIVTDKGRHDLATFI